MAKKLKDMVKKNPVANPTFGTDPSNPWATKYNVTEASETELLARYLNSRGINPHFVPRDTKIAHAKSAEYAKWKADHTERFAREETEQLDELSPATMASYILKTSGKDPKRAEPRKKIMSKLAKVMAKRPADPNAPRFSTNVFGEGFDDPKEIAKELVKRHGKNVTKQHVRDIEGERDTRGSLDHDEVMNHVKKLNEAKKLTSLDKFRKASAEREKKHAEIEKQSKEKPDMKGAIDRLEKHLNKEAADAGVSKAKETSFHKKLDKLVHSTFGKRKDEMKMKEEVVNEITQSDVDKSAEDENAHARKLGWKVHDGYHHRTYDHPKHGHIDMDRYGEWQHRPKAKITGVGTGDLIARGQSHELNKHLSSLKEETLDELNYDTVKSLYKKRRDDFHGDQIGKKKKGKEVSAKNVSRSISRLMGFKPTQKEEIEQIDEISKSTLASYKDKSTASLKNAQANRDAAEFGKHMSKGFADLHAKSDAIAKKRVKGLIGYMQRKQGMKPTSEDAFQDTYAATQMPFDGANTTNDTSMKREMSKSARIIKSIYKRKNMKEELADWEKEDKSVQTYGKKPKLDMTDKKSNIGENKPEARAVMTGGKTLTGQDRDMVEIDPAMKNRPDRPDTFDKGYPKKSPA